MNKNQEVKNQEGLIKALSNMLKQEITSVTAKSSELQGGTVAEVHLITGQATCSRGQIWPFKVVHKIQKEWKRHADHDSWTREYDLYQSDLESLMSEDLKWPTCYHSQKIEGEIQLWMEYLDGVTGHDLDLDMFQTASKEIGRFQGRLLRDRPDLLGSLHNLSRESMIKEVYKAYAGWPEVHDYIRSDACDLPSHLCQMIINMDAQADDLWMKIEKLPLILSHRDYWVTNIFYKDGKIRLIDWDTSGWGTLGEDIASLIIDETHPDKVIDYYKTCVPAYRQGLEEYVDLKDHEDLYIYEQILLFFGYRLVEDFKFSDSQAHKDYCQQMLQRLYELGQNKKVLS